MSQEEEKPKFFSFSSTTMYPWMMPHSNRIWIVDDRNNDVEQVNKDERF